MKKTTSHGITNFHAERKIYYPPSIDETYINDAGDIMHILSNGNQISDIDYCKHWGSPPKSKVNWKAKGERITHPQARY